MVSTAIVYIFDWDVNPTAKQITEDGGQRDDARTRRDGDRNCEFRIAKRRKAQGLAWRLVGGWRSGPAGLEVGGKDQRTDDGGQRIEENFELRISDLEIGEGVSGQ